MKDFYTAVGTDLGLPRGAVKMLILRACYHPEGLNCEPNLYHAFQNNSHLLLPLVAKDAAFGDPFRIRIHNIPIERVSKDPYTYRLEPWPHWLAMWGRIGVQYSIDNPPEWCKR